MKKIIALDLDETLLNSNGQVTKHTLDILHKCKQEGYIVAISSTRGYGSCKEIGKKINADYICCQSGNMIVNKNGQIIYKHCFNKKQVSDLISIAEPYTKNIVIDSDENLFGRISDDFDKQWEIKDCKLSDFNKHNVYKMCIYFESSYKSMIENFCSKHKYTCRVMRTAPVFLITPGNSDKYYALEKLLKINNLSLDDLIVFGDDHSDLLSIQKAKYGVAVANARKEVLDSAKYVTASNDEDGVAHFLESNILTSACSESKDQ